MNLNPNKKEKEKINREYVYLLIHRRL